MVGGESSDGRLDNLRVRLQDARVQHLARVGPPPLEKPPASMTALAYRIGVELVVATAFGAGIGYLLDQYLGSFPVGLGVMLLVGGAAGVRNVYRQMAQFGLAGPIEGASGGKADSGSMPPDPDDDDERD